MVSPGCTNCYAQRMAARLNAMGVKKYADTTRKSGRRAVWTGRVNFDESALALWSMARFAIFRIVRTGIGEFVH